MRLPINKYFTELCHSLFNTHGDRKNQHSPSCATGKPLDRGLPPRKDNLM